MNKPLKMISVDQLPEGVVELPRKLWPFIWHFIRQAKGPLLVVLVLEGISVGLNGLGPLFYRSFINMFTSPQGLVWPEALRLLALMVCVMFVVQPVFGRLSGWFGWPLFFVHFRERIRYQLVSATRAQSLTYFTDDFAGRIANKIREAGYAITEIASISVFVLWGFTVALVVTGLMLFKAHPLLLVVFAAWVLLYGAFLALYLPRLRPAGRHASDMHSKTSGYVVDSLTNIMLVKLFGQDSTEDQHLMRHQRDTAHASYVNHMGFQRLWLVMSVLTFLLAAPILALTLWGLHQGWMATGDAVMAMTVLPQLINFAWWTAESCTNLFEHLGVTEDAMMTLAKPFSVVDKPGAAALVTGTGGGKVEFRNVSFHYGKNVAEHGGVLHNLSLTIPAGQKVGLVGRSGAGKSTLANLLLRFYDIEGGLITIDNQDISSVTQESLRQHIGMVTQDSSLFHRSIADNIRYGRPTATDAEVEEAARRAHAHAFILTLQDKEGRTGYAALVGERGVKLSGGQRQRIAIARLILENAPILILDEATSALDSEVEAAIQQEMATLMEGKTTIAIAHRLSTIAQMDRLVVMDKGTIVEDGTHAELLAKGGIYAQLWQRQSGGFLGHD